MNLLKQDRLTDWKTFLQSVLNHPSGYTQTFSHFTDCLVSSSVYVSVSDSCCNSQSLFSGVLVFIHVVIDSFVADVIFSAEIGHAVINTTFEFDRYCPRHIEHLFFQLNIVFIVIIEKYLPFFQSSSLKSCRIFSS